MIQKLKTEDVNCGDIIILSAYSTDNPHSCMSVGSIPSETGKIKRDSFLWQAKKNELRMATIASFKGLESKVVFLIDVDTFSDESRRLLNYVAISRACAALYVFYDEAVENERQEMLVTGYSKLI